MHLTDEDVQQYTDARAGNQDAGFIAHLAGCEDCKYRLLRVQLVEPFTELEGLVAVPATSGERRRAPRIRFHERGTLVLLNPLMTVRWIVHVLNISRGGMKLHVPQALEPGATVQIRLRVALVTAEVRYCMRVGGEYQAGVRLVNTFFFDLDRLRHDQDRRMTAARATAIAV